MCNSLKKEFHFLSETYEFVKHSFWVNTPRYAELAPVQYYAVCCLGTEVGRSVDKVVL